MRGLICNIVVWNCEPGDVEGQNLWTMDPTANLKPQTLKHERKLRKMHRNPTPFTLISWPKLLELNP